MVLSFYPHRPWHWGGPSGGIIKPQQLQKSFHPFRMTGSNENPLFTISYCTCSKCQEMQVCSRTEKGGRDTLCWALLLLSDISKLLSFHMLRRTVPSHSLKARGPVTCYRQGNVRGSEDCHHFHVQTVQRIPVPLISCVEAQVKITMPHDQSHLSCWVNTWRAAA